MSKPAAILLSALWVLAACTEKPQTATAPKADELAWQAPVQSYLAPGFKPGDKAQWESQLRNRGQLQNEYTRVAAR